LRRNGELSPTNNMQQQFSRKGFLLRAGLVTTGIFLDGCAGKISGGKEKYKHIGGKLNGPDAKAGHLLRGKTSFPAPCTARSVDTLIIGAGISGLSAGRWLKKQGFDNFEILELENHVGGNAHSLKNNVSAYPLGAHYITTANNDDQELIDFLEEVNVITHFENGLPFYNEYYLCFDPEERLLINGQWQEGLIPKFGIGTGDTQQLSLFFKLIGELKSARGNDGKYAFNIPVDRASADPKYRALDQLSFKNYLLDKGFNSKYLFWYLDYCCKDDYGQKTDRISAWAGINYFAGHKGKAANAEESAVLTWPEGNGWLVGQLRTALEAHIRTSCMVYELLENPDGRIIVGVFDLLKQTTSTLTVNKVILASPQFVNQRLLGSWKREFDAGKVSYSPWMVANVTLKNFGSAGLSWDNVPYGTPSVGYVYAGQQQVTSTENDSVITFYLPLCGRDPRVSRLAAYARNYQQWLELIVPELEFMHPGITDQIVNIDVWVWGHGMVSPTVNYLWGGEREKGMRPLDDKVFFAHTDLSGISLFEEAFHQGIRAATELLNL